MVKEIQKPNINFKFWVENDYKFYYDEENKEYFLENKWKSRFYFNLKGYYHRINKPAIEYSDGRKQWLKNGYRHRFDGPAKYCDFYIAGYYHSAINFADETNHLICNSCNKFCKQGCFI